MRWLLTVLAMLAVAAAMPGCLEGSSAEAEGLSAIAACRSAPVSSHVFYFGPGGRLQPEMPPAGSAPGNSFSGGFLTNDLEEWLSDPVPAGLWLIGDVTLEYYVRSTGTPAPLVIGGEPGQGYHFFNQFGSDRTFQPSYAVEYSTATPQAGAIDHYNETLVMPEGGFVVEAGDRLRVLLTDLALDGPSGGGHEVLFGPSTPSQVRFAAKCWGDVRWSELERSETPVSLPGNQGLLTGAVPAGPANQASFPFVLPEGAERLRIDLRQTMDANPVKDDVDMVLLDSVGAEVWSIGSPYSDESGTLWLDNLQWAFPNGSFTVQVNSYSGAGYSGVLTVTAETAQA